MKVPFNDLSRIHEKISQPVLTKLQKTVSKSDFILSDQMYKFEEKFSKFTNSKFTISCSSGTDALELILRALNIKNGDEVILPANTFIATALAVTKVGATPVLVDNNSFYLIDTKKIDKKITTKTKAVIGVHLYGQQSNNEEIIQICNKNKIYYIEDSAQAHGSLYKESPPGTFGVAAAYSFYPGKNLGAWGDGGAITTNNKDLAEKLYLLRNWGSKKKYFHEVKGFNSRLNTLQAIVLTEKLKYLNEWNAQRNQIAKKYFDRLSDLNKIVLPKTHEYNFHTWHLFCIRTRKRKNLINFLKINKIETGIHYPIPIHKQKAYKDEIQLVDDLNISESMSKELVSLPIFPLMKEKEVDYVIKKIKEFYT